MRVKFIIALAIASVLLLGSAGIAFAADTTCPCGITGVPTAEQLTAQANSEISNFGFPDLGAIEAVDTANFGAVEGLDDVGLDSPICGVCGEIPPCSCQETLTTFNGPQVNLGCPLVIVTPVPVNLVSPKVALAFPTINLAPQFPLALPQVNTQLNCFDINCLPVTSINPCPVVDP